MEELHIYYDLYEDFTFVERITNKEIALFLLLHNYIKSNYSLNCYFDIVNSIGNKNISHEQIKIIDKKLVKVNKYNNHITVYSPYDLDLFQKTELSILYQKFYDDKLILSHSISQTTQNISQSISQIVLPQTHTQTHAYTPVPKQEKTQALTQEKPIQEKTQASKINIKMPPDFTKDEFDDMKNLLDKLENEKKDYDKKHKEKEENFMEIDANKRYDEKKERKEKDREKEKYNIFKADVKIYDKLIHEKNFSESFVPQLFEAKYYIIKYLYNNDYFMDEDIDNPSEELFELYRTIYDYANNKIDTNSDIYETFNDVFKEFDESLPKNKQILTDRQIMDTLNDKSEKTEIFKGDAVVDILLANSDIDSDSESESESES